MKLMSKEYKLFHSSHNMKMPKSQKYIYHRGVDNEAAGAAAAAPIIWLVVVLQKWWTFRFPKQFFPLMNAIWVNFSETNH